MDLKTKKIISKEILILLSSVGISLICFFGIYGYNFYKVVRSNYLFNDINTKQKQSALLSSTFDYKQRKHIWYFNVLSELFENVGSTKEFDTEEKLWNYSLKYQNIDTIKRKWNEMENGPMGHEYMNYYIKMTGFNSPQSVKKFIDENSISNKDSTDYNKALVIQKEIDELANERNLVVDSKLSFKEQKKFGYISFVVLISIFFGIRYLYYLIKWCTKTLKE